MFYRYYCWFCKFFHDAKCCIRARSATILRDRERVVVVVAARLLRDQAELLELGELFAAQPGRVEQFLAATAASRPAPDGSVRRSARCPRSRRSPRAARAVRLRCDARRHEAAVDRVELLLDDPQRQVVVLLLREHVAQPRHVAGGELAVPGRCALGLHQPLVLEEADLADREIGEFRLEVGQDVTDREGGAAAAAMPAAARREPRRSSCLAPTPVRTAAVR